MKNGTFKNYVITVLVSVLATFVVMWLTLGANAASQADLKSVREETQLEGAELEIRVNEKIEKLSTEVCELKKVVEQTTASVNQLVGYNKAKEENKSEKR